VAVWSFPVVRKTCSPERLPMSPLVLLVVSTAAPNHLRPVIFTSLLLMNSSMTDVLVQQPGERKNSQTPSV
jgi:hypothetical protein